MNMFFLGIILIIIFNFQFSNMKNELYLILHNIRSIYNTASIFRTADGAGVKKIFLSGYTPKPIDEFGKIRDDFRKISLGAEKTIEWEYVKNINNLIIRLKKEKIKIIALEQAEGAINCKKFKPKFPLALILGNEVRGVPQNILNKCDAVIEIPMRGKKESLNVSVAVGIAVYEILK